MLTRAILAGLAQRAAQRVETCVLSRGRRCCKGQWDRLKEGLASSGLAGEEHLSPGPKLGCGRCRGSSRGARSLLAPGFVSRVELYHATIRVPEIWLCLRCK